MSDTINVRLPMRWADDALDRELAIGAEVRRTSRHVWLEMSHLEYLEALSDAEYYADPYGPATDPEYVGLRASARSAAKTLREVEEFPAWRA